MKYHFNQIFASLQSTPHPNTQMPFTKLYPYTHLEHTEPLSLMQFEAMAYYDQLINWIY